jgi:hypothetical protein
MKEYRSFTGNSRFSIDLRFSKKVSMKDIRGIVVGFLASLAVAHGLVAGNMDLEIHCTPKKLDADVKKGSDGGVNKTKEHWVYEVTVENKTFKEISSLDVTYVIFYQHEELGVKAAPTPKRQNGNLMIPELKPHEKKSITTGPVELSKSNLVGGWMYPSGAKPGVQDMLSGLALRVYQNGQQFAEYANPPNLAKEKWE